MESIEAKFEFGVNRDGFHISGDGNFTYRAEGMHLEAHYQGRGQVPSQFAEENDSELLVLGQGIYLKTPPLGSGWLVATPEEFAADWQALQRQMQARSPIDYANLISNAGDTQLLGSQEIDGRTYNKYITTTDAGSVFSALADAYGTQGQTMFVNRYSGSVPVDVWLDPETLLPRRLVVDGVIDYLGGDTNVDLLLDLEKHNAAGALPEAPGDARPLSDLFSS